MFWIFALGTIGFCIVSVGFRKLVFGLIGVVACVAIGTLVYFKYQDHLQTLQDEQEAIGEAKYPVCVGKDQTIAWLEAGGKCRQSMGDPDMDAVLAKASSSPVSSTK